MKNLSLAFFGLTTLATCSLHGATLTALTTFGPASDGILLPAAYGGSGLAGGTERNFAYNPTTNNLVLVSRNGSNAVRTYNGTTGAAVATLTAPGAGYTSSTLNITAVGVATDGQIFVSNLGVGNAGGTSLLSVYSWPNEAAAPVTSTYAIANGLRLGDSMDAIGSGPTAQVVLGGNIGTTGSSGVDGFAVFPSSALTGSTFTATVVDPTSGSADGAFRLSAAFVDADTVIGNQNGTTRITDFSGSATSGMAPISLATPTSERHVDTIVIDGKTYLATLDSLSTAGRNTVRVYELSGSTATLQATANLIGTASVAGQSNGNGTGDIEWGKVTGTEATLYSLTTNYGIQAFTFSTIPEPTSALLGLAGLGVWLGRRRR